MIKFLVSLILVILLAYAAYLYNNILPWWGVAVAAFLAGTAVPQKPWLSWLAGFTGIFALWAILAAIASNNNAGLLAGKMANILPLNGNTTLLFLVTGLVGALVGGFAALTGAYLRKKPVQKSE